MTAEMDDKASLPAHGGVHYVEFTSKLSVARDTKRYVEVGVERGELLEGIQAETAVGVDPRFVLTANVAYHKQRLVLHQMTSDAFFADAGAVATVGGPPDLVFLDGMHHFEFLLRDVFNSEAISSPETLILLHDCLPLNDAMARRDQADACMLSLKTPFLGYWTGDVWKVPQILRRYRPDLRLVYLDCPPTGLVCISRLDPTSRVLADNVDAIVAEAAAIPNDWAHIRELYAEITITSSKETMEGDLGRFCRD